eukprot:5674364-Prymnesium_polylepis.2
MVIALAAAPLAVLDTRRGLLFVHVPKTGGSAVEEAISQLSRKWKGPGESLLYACDDGTCGDDGDAGRTCFREFPQTKAAWPADQWANADQAYTAPLWGNPVHYSDAMSRCLLSRVDSRGPFTINTSYALIRDPVERAVSAWDWMAQHEPKYQNISFEQFVRFPDATKCTIYSEGSETECLSLVLHPFGVPQCAFVETK